MNEGPAVRRFHITVGPASLFERCLFVVRSRLEPIDFGRSVAHFVQREAERDPPAEILGPFSSSDWELVTVEALISSGKWFTAGWRRVVKAETWFLAFGRSGSTSELVTAYPAPSGVPIARFKNGPDIVQPDDPFFQDVDRVNRGLMAAELKP